jgi:hypothetical protein
MNINEWAEKQRERYDTDNKQTSFYKNELGVAYNPVFKKSVQFVNTESLLRNVDYYLRKRKFITKRNQKRIEIERKIINWRKCGRPLRIWVNGKFVG